MRLDQSERQISLRRKLREHPPDTFGDAVELCRRCYPELDEPQVTEIAAIEQPHLWRRSQQRETYLTRGGKRGEKGGLSTAPPSDRHGNVALCDFDATAERLDEYRPARPIDLSADDIEDGGILSLANGMLKGTGPRKKGNASIAPEDDIDPRRTSNVRELDSQDALRGAAKRRGFTPVDEKLLADFLNDPAIDDDAAAGDADAAWVIRARTWLYQNQLDQTAHNIKKAFDATADK
jgi:hypothetical protein